LIVADTNLLVYLLLPGEHTESAEAVMERDSEWLAPLLWRSEFRNVLAFYVRRKQLELGAAIDLAAEAEALMSGREFLVAGTAVLQLTARSRHSAYDCEFVALAEQEGLPLVTSDRRILDHFPDTAKSPAEFLQA